MKRFAVLFAFLALPLVAAAQDATLFDDSIDHGGHGGLIVKTTPINGQAALMLGAEAVWTLDNSVYVGVQGMSVFNSVDAVRQQADGTPYLLWLNEAGVRAGYVHESSDLVHLTGGAFVGAGSMQLADRYFWTDPAAVETYGDQQYYFIVEPEVAVELNVAPWMRAKLGASYRIVAGAEHEGITNGDLSGPAGALTLMFGVF